jgi:lipopolysaccharide/colanic/teichoic acid biosynthesis glycosyltransferase
LEVTLEVLPIPWWKRTIDLGFGLIGLVCALPVMIVIGVIVFVSSGWPIFFVQERVGRNGKLFRVWKFRTMVLGSESVSPVAGSSDPRLTAIGHILRRFKLDELPQLVSVVRGKMSLVGPRPVEPERTKFFMSQNGYYCLRHLALPGLTGYAQVNGACHEIGESEEALWFDLRYIQFRSLTLDLEILYRTIKTILEPHEG